MKMDPVTVTIVSAFAAGAAAAAKDIATSAVRDAYAGLKRLIVDRYERAAPSAEDVEEAPVSQARHVVLAEKLDQAGASGDEELKAAAQALLAALEGLREEARAAALFDFDKLRAARNFQLKNIKTTGTVIKAREANFGGDFTAEGIDQSAGGTGEKH
jgi:hypothetical protein